MADDLPEPPGAQGEGDAPPPLDLPGLDFSVDKLDTPGQDPIPASGEAPAPLPPSPQSMDSTAPLDLPGLDGLGSPGEDGALAPSLGEKNSEPLDLPGLEFSLDLDETKDEPAALSEPASPGESSSPGGLPSLDLTGVSDGGDADSKDEIPALDLGGDEKPSESSFLDEAPATGEALGFESADDVLGLDTKEEGSVLDETEPESILPVVKVFSKKKLFIGLGVGFLIFALASAGAFVERYSIRQSIKGWIAKPIIEDASRIRVAGGLDKDSLTKAIETLENRIVTNPGVEIADVQILKVYYNRFTEDKILDLPEFLPLESMIRGLASKRPPQ